MGGLGHSDSVATADGKMEALTTDGCGQGPPPPACDLSASLPEAQTSESSTPRPTTPPGGRRALRSHPGLCGRCWAWRGAGNGGSSTSGQRSPAGDKGGSEGGGQVPDRVGGPGGAPTPSSAPRLPTTHPHPHLQLSHHKLLGQVVPLGLPEDGGMAQVMLQTPTLSLGRGAGSGAGGKGPQGALPTHRTRPPLMLHLKTLWANSPF